MASVDKHGFGTNGQPPALRGISIKPETGNCRKWGDQDELTTEGFTDSADCPRVKLEAAPPLTDGLCQLVHHFINRVFIEVTVGRAYSPVAGGRPQHVALEAGVHVG